MTQTLPNNLNLLASQELSEFSGRLREALIATPKNLLPEHFSEIFTPLMASVLERGYGVAGADAGGIWLVDDEETELALMAAHGHRVQEFVGKYTQPLSTGLISMVYATGQPFCENDIAERPGHSPVLDELLGVTTQAMIAVPFDFAHRIRGVVSCVQFTPADERPAGSKGFDHDDLREVQLAAASVQGLLDLQLIEYILGWNEQ